MGRFKVDTYWYLFIIGGVLLAGLGIVLLYAVPREPATVTSWGVIEADHHEERYYLMIFVGIVGVYMGVAHWIKNVSRIKVPRSVHVPVEANQLKNLEKALANGKITQEEYARRHDRIAASLRDRS